MAPRTRYVENSGCTIAYQVIGEGPVDLMFIPGLISHVDMQWADPLFSHALDRLASFCRLIIFDHRGVGLSDSVTSIPTLDERVSDARAVMDAAGSERAFLLGHCNGGPVGVMLASLYPERTRGLVLCSTFAKGRPDEDHPGALPAQSYDSHVRPSPTGVRAGACSCSARVGPAAACTAGYMPPLSGLR